MASEVMMMMVFFKDGLSDVARQAPPPVLKDGAGNVSVEQEELLEDAQLLSVRPAQHRVKDLQQCAHCVDAPQLLLLVADWICVQIVALDRNS